MDELVTPVDPRFRREQRLQLRSFAFDRLGAFAAVLDADGVIIDTNEAWRLFAQLNGGSPTATGPGRDYLSVCDQAAAEGDEIAAAVATGLREILSGIRVHFDIEYPCPAPGQERWFVLQASSAPVDDRDGIVLFHLDITARKQLEDQLRRLAMNDELTGLANRRAAVQRIDELLGEEGGGSERSPAPVSVLYLDLDGFKNVNDTFGHHIGDDVLVQVAARLRRAVRGRDLAARLAGDEFVVVCPSTDGESAAVIADRIRRALSVPFQSGPHEIHVGVAVGMATSTGGSTVDEMLRDADAGMYAEKALDRRQVPGVA